MSMRVPLWAATVRGFLFCSIAAACVFLNETAAAEPQNLQPAAPGDNLVINGRLKDGVVACEACHRRTGEGDAGSAFSNLTGLTKEYIAKQLKDFQSGARESRVMQVVAQNLSGADIAALSSYYAGLPPLPLSTNIPAAPQIGIALAETGDANRGLRPCISCHDRKAISADSKTSCALRSAPTVPQEIGLSSGKMARRKPAPARKWRTSRRNSLRPRSTPFRFTSPDCQRRRHSPRVKPNSRTPGPQGELVARSCIVAATGSPGRSGKRLHRQAALAMTENRPKLQRLVLYAFPC